MNGELRGSVVSLHGHQMHYVKAGSGPVVVLLHGLLGNRQSWSHLMSVLVQDFTVLAPDLFGHGESAKSLADYSLGAHAGTLRDLMETLEIGNATIVALREGSEALGRQLRKLGLPTSPDIVEAWRGFTTLGDTDSRRAFLATIRTIVGPRGQTVDAHEKIYLFDDLPVQLVWGARDRLIPVRHAVVTHNAIRGSRLEIFPRAGHFPHLCDPERFATVLRRFVDTTSPRRYDPARWRSMLARSPHTVDGDMRATDD